MGKDMYQVKPSKPPHDEIVSPKVSPKVEEKVTPLFELVVWVARAEVCPHGDHVPSIELGGVRQDHVLGRHQPEHAP